MGGRIFQYRTEGLCSIIYIIVDICHISLVFSYGIKSIIVVAATPLKCHVKGTSKAPTNDAAAATPLMCHIKETSKAPTNDAAAVVVAAVVVVVVIVVVAAVVVIVVAVI